MPAFLAAGDDPVLLTGTRWFEAARAAGIEAVELAGLAPGEFDDSDSGAKLHQRAARMAILNEPALQPLRAEVVVSDAITACGAWQRSSSESPGLS